VDATGPVRSARRSEYPHSLSYQPTIFTRSPVTFVNPESKMHGDRSVTISEEAMGFLGVGEEALQLTVVGRGGERGVDRLGGCRLADDDDEIGVGTVGHRHPQRVPDVTLSPGSGRGWTWRTVCAVSNEPSTPEAAHRLPVATPSLRLPRLRNPTSTVPQPYPCVRWRGVYPHGVLRERSSTGCR
jgi:hypothetical protein